MKINDFTIRLERYAIILREEFSCLESITNRDTINWILKNEYRRSIMEHLPKRITEELKRRDWLLWVQSMNNIRSRAEEIICTEMIFC